MLGDWVRETGWMPVLHSREEDVAFVEWLISRAEVTVAEGGFLAREGEEVLALYLSPRRGGAESARRCLTWPRWDGSG